MDCGLRVYVFFSVLLLCYFLCLLSSVIGKTKITNV